MKYSFEYYPEGRKRYKVDGIAEEVIDGIPLDVYRNRPRTLPEIVQHTVERDPGHEAFIYGMERISYGELAQRVYNVAFQWTAEYGVGRGNRVMMLLRNTPEFVTSFFCRFTDWSHLGSHKHPPQGAGGRVHPQRLPPFPSHPGA